MIDYSSLEESWKVLSSHFSAHLTDVVPDTLVIIKIVTGLSFPEEIEMCGDEFRCSKYYSTTTIVLK